MTTENARLRPNRRAAARYMSLRRRLKILRWLLPLSLVGLVIIYELGPARLVFERLGLQSHFVSEILFFGTIGPILAFLLIDMIGRWLDERDTSDWQAQLLAQAQEEARLSRQLNDDALQVLFAAGTLLETCKSIAAELSPEKVEAIEQTERSVNETIDRLRSHLQS
jgi:signal transduction histidine kinase